MRAIIIEDKDCHALVDKLSLVNLETRMRRVLSGRDIDPLEIDAIHRLFHYEVVMWLQDQGWKLR